MADLSAVVVTGNEVSRPEAVLRALVTCLSGLGIEFEIIVIAEQATDLVPSWPESVRTVRPSGPGYGAALEAGFRAATGSWILTLDTDLSHDLSFVQALWVGRHGADVINASRYVDGGSNGARLVRRAWSRLVNLVLGRALDIDVRDLSSGIRLYRSCVIESMALGSRDLSVLVEIIVRAYAGGWRIKEVPLRCSGRSQGPWHPPAVRIPITSLRTAYQMWRLRNSIACADYDARAYDSRIPFQRYWQRRRCEIVARLAGGRGTTLDIGCGSSQTLAALHGSVIGLDILANKLRYARRYGVPLASGDIFCLPFASGAFECVVCSQVVEHLPSGSTPFAEMMRVLKPGGCLVLGTPDYGTRLWRLIEKVYRFVARGAYADEHITHYHRTDLVALLESHGVRMHTVKYVFGSELIVMGFKSQV